MNGLAIKNLAHAIAVVAHDGHSRRGLGEPYIEHIERVADSVYGWEAKSIAYLHDVIEDTSITAEDLGAIGVPEGIVACVAYLTRQPGDTYAQFIDKIINMSFDPTGDGKYRKMTIKIKIADINDNMRDIDDTDMPSLKRRYMRALASLEEALEQ